MDRRQILIKLLVKSDVPLSSESLSKKIGVSKKTILNDLDSLSPEMKKYNLDLAKKPGVGISIKGDIHSVQKFINDLEKHHNDESQSLRDREINILMTLFFTKSPIFFKEIAIDQFVSRATLNRDIARINKRFLREYKLKIINTKNGLIISGKEEKKRSALTKIIFLKCDSKLHLLAVEDDQFIQYLQSLLGIELDNLIDLINAIENRFHIKFSLNAQRNLLIHLAVVILRLKNSKGIKKATSLKSDLANYRTSIVVLKKLTRKIEIQYDVNFTEQELYLILLHVLSSRQTDNGDLIEDNPVHSEKLNEFINKVSQDTVNNFDNDLELKKSLSLHLKISYVRIKYGMKIDNPFLNYVLENSFDLFISIKNNINIIFSNKYKIPDTEIGFIAIHFMASVERLKSKLRVAIVCSSGLGISQLLLQRVKNYFPNYDVIGTISLEDLDKYSNKELDLIISTINLEGKTDLKYIVVDPLEDLSIAQKDLQTSFEREKDTKKPNIKFTSDNCLYINTLFSKEAILRTIAQWLKLNARVDDDYFTVMMNREKIGSTYIGNGIALIHGNYEETKYGASLNIIKLKNNVLWDDKNKVNFLLNFIPTQGTKNSFATLFREMGQTLDDKEFWKRIKNSDFDDMVQLLNKELRL